MRTRKIFCIAAALMALASQSIRADWKFEDGAFNIIGDTTIRLSAQNSYLLLHQFGYFLNDSSKFNYITEEDLDKALTFKDGDKVKFAKKGIFYYYAHETSEQDVFKVTGITIPFTFKVEAQNVQSPADSPAKSAAPAGQPLPALALTSIFALFGVSVLGLRKRLRANKR